MIGETICKTEKRLANFRADGRLYSLWAEVSVEEGDIPAPYRTPAHEPLEPRQTEVHGLLLTKKNGNLMGWGDEMYNPDDPRVELLVPRDEYIAIGQLVAACRSNFGITGYCIHQKGWIICPGHYGALGRRCSVPTPPEPLTQEMIDEANRDLQAHGVAVVGGRAYYCEDSQLSQPAECGYKLGSSWLWRPYPEPLIEWAKRFCAGDKTLTFVSVSDTLNVANQGDTE